MDSFQFTEIHAGADGSHLERAIGELLGVVRAELDLETVFVGEFVEDRRYFRFIDAANEPAVIRAGESHPLHETICQRILDGRMSSLVPDVTAVREINGLPAYYEGMGAHIGVPVRYSDGSLYGVLCGFSFGPLPGLSEKAVRRLEMAARAAARLLAQAEGRSI